MLRPLARCASLSSFYQSSLSVGGAGRLVSSEAVRSARCFALPAVYIDTPGAAEARAASQGGSAGAFSNALEADAVVAVAQLYSTVAGFAPSQLLVATFSHEQARLLLAKLSEAGLHSVACLHVEHLCGVVADVAIISTVRAGAAGAAAAAGAGGGLGWLADSRAICACLSRARESVAVVGSSRCLAADRSWRAAIAAMQGFTSPAAFATAFREQVAAEAGGRVRAQREAEQAAVAHSVSEEARALDELRRLQLAEAQREAKLASGFVEPKRLSGWSTDVEPTPADAGAGTDAGAAAVEAEPTDAGVLAAVEALVLRESGGEGWDPAAAAERVAALAAQVELSPSDCALPVLAALLAPLAPPLAAAAEAEADGAGTAKARLAQAKGKLRQAAPLLGALGTGAVAHAALLAALQARSEAEAAVGAVFSHLLLQLYESELLPEEAILAWADGAARAAPGSMLHKLHAQSAGLLNWLQEAEEESEGDELD